MLLQSAGLLAYQVMEFKVVMVMLFSVTLSILLLINGASLTSHHDQEQASHDLAQENWFGYAEIPRKLLMINQKVEGIQDKDLVYNIEALSGESHKRGEETTSVAPRETMHEGSDLTRLFTMDYTRVRKRRPVHNKSFPATTTFP